VFAASWEKREVKSKRPVIYIAAGVVTALVAIVIANKKMNTARPAAPPDDRVDVLLAVRDIGYSEPLELGGPSANVAFVKWPKNYVPDGAIRDPKEVTEPHMRACADIARNEVIQRRRIVADDQFVPQDLYPEIVGVNPEDVKSKRFRPGMKVDILRIVSNTATDFMRGVRVYAVGKLDTFGHPVKDDDVQPNVFVLIKKADRIPFIEAQLTGRFRLVEAADPKGEGPVLVDQSLLPEARKKQAQQLLDHARQLADTGEPEKALGELDQLLKQYGDVGNFSAQAAALSEKCQQAAADSLLASARQAFDERKDCATTLMLLDKIESAYPQAVQAIAKARQMRPAVEQAQRQSDRLASYSKLIEQIQEALTQGNLPLAEQRVAELDAYSKDTFPDLGGKPAPADAKQLFEEQLKNGQQKYDLDAKIVESLLAQRNLAQAQEKVQQMKERFPAHPQLPALEERVKKATSGAM
jgi:hypothetical protein